MTTTSDIPLKTQGQYLATLGAPTGRRCGRRRGWRVRQLGGAHERQAEGHAISVPVAVFAVMTFGVIPYLLDDGDLKVVLAWVRRVARPRS